ncbi:MAG: hypothetical protein ABIU77_06200 [Ferruginibacter sp.]
MKPAFKNTMIGCSAAYAVIALLILLTTKEASTGIGLTGLLLGVVYFFFGLILCISPSSRNIGKGLLLSAGLVFLIGVSVCSIFPSNVNFH